MIKFIIYINFNILQSRNGLEEQAKQKRGGNWECNARNRRREVLTPLSSPPTPVLQCDYNPGLNSWDKKTIACQNDAFFLSLLPPSAVLVLYTFKLCFNKINTAWGRGRETAEIGSYNNIDPSFLRDTM